MERTIAGYRQDDRGDWVADLSCGHGQHVRHRPPFLLRAWVTEESGRAARLGTALDCPLCDRTELPDGLRVIRSGSEWNEETLPAGLLRPHRLTTGTWGLIRVREGRLRVAISVDPAVDVVIEAGLSQAIPPDTEHVVVPMSPVRFFLDLLALVGGPSTLGGGSSKGGGYHAGPDPGSPPPSDVGGDPACWSGLLCPDCGAVLDGGPHQRDCPRTGAVEP